MEFGCRSPPLVRLLPGWEGRGAGSGWRGNTCTSSRRAPPDPPPASGCVPPYHTQQAICKHRILRPQFSAPALQCGQIPLSGFLTRLIYCTVPVSSTVCKDVKYKRYKYCNYSRNIKTAKFCKFI